jgi:hypothetical protein
MKALRALGNVLVAWLALALVASGQSWQPLRNQPPFQTDTALLLTDGTVMTHEYGSPNWWRLTPDNTGSYANGTWSQTASMAPDFGPYGFASAVLPDGRAIIEGGEFNFKGKDLNLGAIYDPTTDVWTPVNPPTGWTCIDDAPSVVLANGTFMLGQAQCGSMNALLDAKTLTWTTAHISMYPNTEASWILLPNGSVLEVPIDAPHTSRYLPNLDKWVFAGNTVVSLTKEGEVGPDVLRADGTVFATGANGRSAIYDPKGAEGKKWSAGPDFRHGDDIADGPAALLPNGNVLCDTSPGFFSPPVTFYEFDGKSLTQVPVPPNPGATSQYGRMLVLPTGQIFFVVTDNMTIDVELYTASGTYQKEWAPTITTAPSTATRGDTYRISGKQFNGLSQGAMFGDDAQMATNYPLVRITNNSTGHVFYARTHDHSSMGVATGSKIVFTNFDVPQDMETGAAELVVVANGIPSGAVAISVQ